MTIDLSEIIIDRSPAAKAAFVNKSREELKKLGYAVIDSRYLNADAAIAAIRSAPALNAPHNSGERLPDAADAGAGTLSNGPSEAP
jgi:hypothetical protein